MSYTEPKFDITRVRKSSMKGRDMYNKSYTSIISCVYNFIEGFTRNCLGTSSQDFHKMTLFPQSSRLFDICYAMLSRLKFDK